jgi:hypothetical protein
VDESVCKVVSVEELSAPPVSLIEMIEPDEVWSLARMSVLEDGLEGSVAMSLIFREPVENVSPV